VTNVLDALGRTLVSQRIGTDSSEMTLGQNQYDSVGNLMATTNALGGVTTASNIVTANGQRCVTNTYPDGGTRTEVYYLDGRLQSVTGTAVRGVFYTNDVEQDPGGTWREVSTEIKLDASGNPTSEWIDTPTNTGSVPAKSELALGAG
jgi:hypothetical protein